GHRPDQPAPPAAPQSVDVLLLFSHAVASPTVRKEPNTTILSFSAASALAAARACATVSCSSNAALEPAARSASASSAAEAPRAPGSEQKCQRVTRGAISRRTPATSLS